MVEPLQAFTIIAAQGVLTETLQILKAGGGGAPFDRLGQLQRGPPARLFGEGVARAQKTGDDEQEDGDRR